MTFHKQLLKIADDLIDRTNGNKIVFGASVVGAGVLLAAAATYVFMPVIAGIALMATATTTLGVALGAGCLASCAAGVFIASQADKTKVTALETGLFDTIAGNCVLATGVGLLGILTPLSIYTGIAGVCMMTMGGKSVVSGVSQVVTALTGKGGEPVPADTEPVKAPREPTDYTMYEKAYGMSLSPRTSLKAAAQRTPTEVSEKVYSIKPYKRP